MIIWSRLPVKKRGLALPSRRDDEEQERCGQRCSLGEVTECSSQDWKKKKGRSAELDEWVLMSRTTPYP